jgi:hypothetical protein
MVVLGESDAQVWGEGNERKGRCGGGWRNSSLFIGADGGGGGCGGGMADVNGHGMAHS